jgi:hypothetical protein
MHFTQIIAWEFYNFFIFRLLFHNVFAIQKQEILFCVIWHFEFRLYRQIPLKLRMFL